MTALKTSIKALHVLPDFSWGGARQGTLELINHLSKTENVEPYLCVLGPAPGAQEAMDGASTFLGIPDPLGSPRRLLRSAALLRSVIGAQRPAIVHSHLLPADLVAALAVGAMGRGAPVHLSHIRDSRTWLHSRRIADRGRKALLQLAFKAADTRFVAVSSEAADFAVRHLRLPQSKVAVLLNGIDASPFRQLPFREPAQDGMLVIGSAGRLVTEKGHDLLVSAVALLASRGIDARVEIAGDGSSEGFLKALASSKGIGDRLVLRGAVPDMARFYASIDIFVLPSRSEGLSRVLLEAMASGLPVIATAVGGVRDVITDSVDGLIVENTSESIAAAIERMHRDLALRRNLAAAGRSRVLGNFVSERVARDVVRHYHDLIGCAA